LGNEITISIDNLMVSYLTRLLKYRYYRTNAISEIKEIDRILKILGTEEETWMENVN
jgi:hypothetical protein